MDQSRLEQADQLRYDGQYDEAIELYGQLLAESPEDEEIYRVYHGRGLAYQFNGYFDESIADLEQVRERRGDFVKGREDLFKTYLMLGMNDEAIAEMREVKAIDPANEEVAKAAVYFPGF